MVSLESRLKSKLCSAVGILSVTLSSYGCHLLFPFSPGKTDSQISDAAQVDIIKDKSSPDHHDLSLDAAVDSFYDSNSDSPNPDLSTTPADCVNGYSCNHTIISCFATCKTLTATRTIDCQKQTINYLCTCTENAYIHPSAQSGTECQPCYQAAGCK
ncbi:MAG: hypothetical protein ABIA37_01830 [Candidatus Woesearchaeota archaeon]